MQNSDFRTRVRSLYRSQTSPMLFAFKTVTLWPELIVSMGPRPRLSFCAWKSSWLAPELLVSMVSSPHLWFLHAKQRLWVRFTSLYGSQTSFVDLWMQNSALRSRMTPFYWYQPSSVLLCIHNSNFSIRISYLWFCAFKTATLASELLVSTCRRSHLWLLYAKQRF